MATTRSADDKKRHTALTYQKQALQPVHPVTLIARYSLSGKVIVGTSACGPIPRDLRERHTRPGPPVTFGSGLPVWLVGRWCVSRLAWHQREEARHGREDDS